MKNQITENRLEDRTINHDAIAVDVEPWTDPVDGEDLLDELSALLKRFVVLPKWGAEALPLWILHTHAFQLRDITAYVGVESPEKRCGKTTLLTLASQLVCRPVIASNISPPAFFRVIEEVRPTLLIDEADTFLAGNEELRGILNSGCRKAAAFVVRVTSQAEGVGQLTTFSTWCPKMIAAIGRLPNTLGDRCILIRMERKMPNDECERLRNLDMGAMQRKCARFVLDHAAEIVAARPAIPRSLNDRAADTWEPLLALADLAGGQWPELARRAAEGLTAATQENNPIGSLLLDIFVVFASEKKDRLFTRTLVEALNERGDRPWTDMMNGKGITDRWLSRQLRPYGISPRAFRIGGELGKGYMQNDCMETFRRYISRSDMEALKAECKFAHEEGRMTNGEGQMTKKA
jgi:hypothetical protein